MKCNNPLEAIGITPITYEGLESRLHGYLAPHNKIGRLEEAGTLIRLKRGLYVVAEHVHGKSLSMELMANHIYGPSYVSMDWALKYYGLVRKADSAVSSVTQKHTRVFANALGTFKYICCSHGDYFYMGVKQKQVHGMNFLIASREKALCDYVIYTAGVNLRSYYDTLRFLEKDLELDMKAFHGFDRNLLEQLAHVGRKKQSILQIASLLPFRRGGAGHYVH